MYNQYLDVAFILSIRIIIGSKPLHFQNYCLIIAMENIDSEVERLLVENAKLKASLKASNYEKEKLLELVKNLLLNLDGPYLFDTDINCENQNDSNLERHTDYNEEPRRLVGI